jgi:hypothetical protein
MNAYLSAMLDRVKAFRGREQEKRTAEEEAFNRAMAENAEYIANLDNLPFGHVDKE